MFKQDTQSVQQLLVAEKKAEERVNQARKRKILRLKQAKEEAKIEIDQFRAEKEKEFKEYETKFLGTKETKEIEIERSTEKLLKEMEKFVRLNKDEIISYLIEQIFTINGELHANFRIGGEY